VACKKGATYFIQTEFHFVTEGSSLRYLGINLIVIIGDKGYRLWSQGQGLVGGPDRLSGNSNSRSTTVVKACF
jgi:hypothetical protein